MIKSSIVRSPSHLQAALAPVLLKHSTSIREKEADFGNSFSELCSEGNQPSSRPLPKQG